MSLKLFYECLSFIVAGFIFKKFAFPMIFNMINEYRDSITNQISDLEYSINTNNDLYNQLTNEIKNIEIDFKNVKNDIDTKLNTHKIKLEEHYAKIIDKQNKQFRHKIRVLHEQYEQEIITKSIEIFKEKAIKNIKNNYNYPKTILQKFKKSNIKKIFN